MAVVTVVVLADEDGDEFPIGVAGYYNGTPEEDEALERIARERAAEFVAEGSFRPTGELTVARIEGGQ